MAIPATNSTIITRNIATTAASTGTITFVLSSSGTLLAPALGEPDGKGLIELCIKLSCNVDIDEYVLIVDISVSLLWDIMYVEVIGGLASLLDDIGCISLLLPSKILLVLALGVEKESLPLDGKEDLTGLGVKFSSIVNIGSTHVEGMGDSLMQGIVHLDEAGG